MPTIPILMFDCDDAAVSWHTRNDTLQLIKQRTRGTDIDEVLYADDTICFTQTVAAMNRLLNAIEEEGTQYGLNLNRNTCEHLSFVNAGDVRFANGDQVPNTKSSHRFRM